MAPKSQRASSLRHAGASAVAPAHSQRHSRTSSQRRSTAKSGSARGRSSNLGASATPAVVENGTSKPDTARVLDLVQSGASNASDSVAATFGEQNISSDELLEIRSLKRPPRVVQRALEATYMLLMAAELPRPFAPPEWSSVQKLLADAGLFNRMLMYDMGLLRGLPELVSYLKAEYFGGVRDSPSFRNTWHGSGGFHDSPSPRNTWRSSALHASADEENLTFERVLRASHAAAALFRWCSMTVATAAEPVPSETPAVEEKPAAEAPPALHLDLPAAAGEAEASDVAVEETPWPRQRADRHFETVVPSLPFAISTSITLPIIVEIMTARPDLCLELVASVDPIEGPYKAKERLQNVKDYFSSNGTNFISEKGLQKVSPKGEAGVTCLLHLDNDADLVRFFRNQRLQDKSPRMMAETPRDLGLRTVVEKLEEWFEIHMHF